MEIKILVPENRKSDLDNFIKDCENKGFELQRQGGGHMPNFSGYYATLEGDRWEPNPTAQLQADKAELFEGVGEETFPTNVDIWKWWKTQEFQKERGEQEYTMIYEIDLPKILRAFYEHITNTNKR